MKTYEVELKRTSFITMYIQADSEEEAEAKAWSDLEHNYPHLNDSTWEVNSIEESED